MRGRGRVDQGRIGTLANISPKSISTLSQRRDASANDPERVSLLLDIMRTSSGFMGGA
jgi:hypothetical protein